MKTSSSLAAVGAALLLGGCGHHHNHQQHLERLGPELHQRPLVFVKAGIISISPEPIVLQAGTHGKGITWQLPPGTQFDGRGIEILGRLVDAERKPVKPDQKALEKPGLGIDASQRDAFSCSVVDKERRQVNCLPNGKPGARGVYKYQIHVLHEGTRLTWDPNILHLD